ncbi:HAMP domain-containing protein [Stutzerimonas sp. VN223-3]|uniref:sensor histidine kinase n=1 Tax=Stutzerimonas sp. VN223-3 TaxID=3384601 RepID=UPI0038B4AD67
MAGFLRNLPIGTKIIAAILLASTLSLMGAAVVIIGYEANTARDRMSAELLGLARLLAVNTEAALRFNDEAAAAENLNSLVAQPHIVSAAVYSSDGSLFAEYRASPLFEVPEQAPTPGERFSSQQLELVYPIGPQDDPAGVVYLKTDLAPLTAFIKRYALIVVGMFGAVWLCAALLAALLQRVITAPILRIVEVARAVTDRSDYSLRADKQGTDEIGDLSDALNQMLAQIQTQHQQLEKTYSDLGVKHDSLLSEMSERRKADEALRALNAELESRVAARTAQLEESNHELESFSYSVSHDLRAPLRGMDGFSRILLEEYGPRLDAEGLRLIGVIRQNCASMGRLIDDLLAFSRLGRKQLSKTKVDMEDLVADVIAQLAAVPGEDLPSIERGPLPTVACDPSLVRQVWTNLIANAVKFSKGRNTPQIRIWAEQRGREQVFVVADNGVGFDMDYYEKLFAVFQRLHGNDEFPGTGVGLATVKRIVVRHGGQVWAQAKPDQGATFYFSLPEGNDDGHV